MINGLGGNGFLNLETGAIVFEIAKKDASISTLCLVHDLAGNRAIECLGNEE
jgi:hypothetical protein